MATEIENLRGALRGMLNLYTRMSGVACGKSFAPEVRAAIRELDKETAIKSLLGALDMAEATIERLRLGRHAPGSFQGTIDVIRAARGAAQ